MSCKIKLHRTGTDAKWSVLLTAVCQSLEQCLARRKCSVLLERRMEEWKAHCGERAAGEANGHNNRGGTELHLEGQQAQKTLFQKLRQSKAAETTRKVTLEQKSVLMGPDSISLDAWPLLSLAFAPNLRQPADISNKRSNQCLGGSLYLGVSEPNLLRCK